MSIELIVAIIQALVGFATEVPELVAAGKTAIELLRSGTAPTPDQQARINVALEAANTALQAS